LMLEFTSLSRHKPGTMYALLERSYAELLSADPEHWEPSRKEWQEFDQEAFARIDTIGACVFVTMSDGEAIGFGSFDPSQAPELGIVGHNCIVPEFRGRGFGRQQIEEILKRLRERGISKALVQTGDHPFFTAAQQMYMACGFVEVQRLSGGPDPRYCLIEYTKDL